MKKIVLLFVFAGFVGQIVASDVAEEPVSLSVTIESPTPSATPTDLTPAPSVVSPDDAAAELTAAGTRDVAPVADDAAEKKGDAEADADAIEILAAALSVSDSAASADTTGMQR